MYPGIDTLLKDLSEQGVKLAVASSKPGVFVEKILTYFGIRDYFSAVVGSELDGRRINKDEVVLEALRQLGVIADADAEQYLKEKEFAGEKRNDCAMVGDRKFDVEGANLLIASTTLNATAQ